ncbi:MAG: MFS transporter [Eubacterium sp.]|nr:MFS transporter [Eubacterium sp.]
MAKRIKNANTYTGKEATMYLTGMFGQNMIYNIVATGLYYYFQNVICLDAVALGWIFAIARVWDAINDPMMGTIVDRTNTKWGKCKPYLMFCPILICVITCLTFLNGNYAEAKLAGNSTAMLLITAWAAISYILWGMSYTIGDIPLWGVIPRMTEDEGDRAKLISLARIIASIGAAVVVVGIIPVSQALNKTFGENENAQKGFIVAGFAFTIVGSLLFELAGIGVKEKVNVKEDTKTMKESFKLMWSCVPFRRILISGVLRSPMQLMSIIVITLFTYYYCDGDMNTAFTDPKKLVILLIVGGGFFIGQFGAMALFPILIKKIDTKTLYNLTALSGIPTGLIFVLYKLAPYDLAEIKWVSILGVLILLGGAGFGLVMVCQSMMISDCIDYEEYHNGHRPDGVFFSGQSFITKLSAGIASIMSAYVFAFVGYTDVNIDKMNKALAAGANFAKDYESYSSAMWFLLTVPPAIGMIIAVIPTIKYEITKPEHEKMLSALVERHKEK